MDTLEKQLLALQEKVDALYQIIEQLNVKFLAVIDTGKVKLTPEAKDTVNINYSKYSNPWYQSYGDSTMEHKDVLKDHNRSGESSSQSSGQQAMSTELQIQRLTAQLTAAYNRIAALEEQLVARRVHQ